jgi:hypothetical protein
LRAGPNSILPPIIVACGVLMLKKAIFGLKRAALPGGARPKRRNQTCRLLSPVKLRGDSKSLRRGCLDSSSMRQALFGIRRPS